MEAKGPLNGLRVLELAGLAPGPFAGLVLSDYGADVVRVDRRAPAHSVTQDSLTRGKRSVALDLKDKKDRDLFLELARHADVLIEGYRPGVMEALGLAPRYLREINPRLIYARLTGFQRLGKWSGSAGHDINYIALSGLLHALGTKERPLPPGNILGDFAGGGMTCVLGILLALNARQRTGCGSVVEANMVDGASYLGTFVRHAQNDAGIWGQPRGENLLDGGCPYYRCYRTRDDKFMAIGALEPQFYQAFLTKFGLSKENQDVSQDRNRNNWTRLETIFTTRFAELSRSEWCQIYDGTDACITPVLDEILSTKVPVSIDGYPGLPDSITHEAGQEKMGLKPGQDQRQVVSDWLDKSTPASKL